MITIDEEYDGYFETIPAFLLMFMFEISVLLFSR